MKNNKSKRPAIAGNKNKSASHNFSKPPRDSGALNLQKKREEIKIEKIDIAQIIKKTNTKTNKKLPELLAPAGSLEALKVAIAGGADAVYFGGGDFNARINAKNFTNEELKYAINLLHSCGRKAYITLNTLVHDRELEDYLRFAEFVYLSGADALIVADLGGADAIHRHLPNLELHASTQMSGHNIEQAKLLANHGFSRMVCARELPKNDIAELVANSPIEIEMFTHGALCVCHSGQCLFSSIVGGRSGNRGECAQPCRLPYKNENGEQFYPLSLKDLSLANHITELIDCGVHSLKIEGRMKSPEYVFGVVRAFRTLLDEGRNATPQELSNLAKIFSRDGFTDAYYQKNISSAMLGVRSDEQKQISKIALESSEKMDEITPIKTKINAFARVCLDRPSELTLSCGDIEITAYGATPDKAINAPLTPENIKKNLTKFGATNFALEDFSLIYDEAVIMPISALNELRRSACEMLEAELYSMSEKRVGYSNFVPIFSQNNKNTCKTARFVDASQITKSAKEYFDIIYLPLHKFNGECEGVILPPVIFDSETKTVDKMLSLAKEKGAKYALVGNLGALELAKKHSFDIHGDFRFNVYNNETVVKLENLGVKNIILSPELTLPQMRDIKGDTSTIVYGRLPLMLLEKCVNTELGSCESCKEGALTLTDRKGISFPTTYEFAHRNVIYNSAPTYMADRETDLKCAGITNRHFIFSIESANEVDEIIHLYKTHSPAEENKKIRRI